MTQKIKIKLMILFIFLIGFFLFYFFIKPLLFKKVAFLKPEEELNLAIPTEGEIVDQNKCLDGTLNSGLGEKGGERNDINSVIPFLSENEKELPPERQKELVTKEYNDIEYEISPVREVMPLGLANPILECDIVTSKVLSQDQLRVFAENLISNILKDYKEANQILLNFYIKKRESASPFIFSYVEWIKGEVNNEINIKIIENNNY